MFSKNAFSCVIQILAVNLRKCNTCGEPPWNAPRAIQSYFLYIDVDLSCPTLRRPRVLRQNAEDYVSVKSLLRFSYFPVIAPMIQLRSRIPSLARPDKETGD